MALRVHALLVADVVTLLERIPRGLRSAGPGECATGKAYTSAHAGARIAADEAAGSRADRRADDRAFHRRVVGRLRRGGAADLRRGELPAIVIVVAELIDALS